jgi:dihydrofolate synthase/folylpolyglutamate synthase
MELVADPGAAVARARELAGPAGAVLATGSIYLVADLARAGTERRASTL